MRRHRRARLGSHHAVFNRIDQARKKKRARQIAVRDINRASALESNASERREEERPTTIGEELSRLLSWLKKILPTKSGT
jgi:hypothetical protein